MSIEYWVPSSFHSYLRYTINGAVAARGKQAIWTELKHPIDWFPVVIHGSRY